MIVYRCISLCDIWIAWTERDHVYAKWQMNCANYENQISRLMWIVFTGLSNNVDIVQYSNWMPEQIIELILVVYSSNLIKFIEFKWFDECQSTYEASEYGQRSGNPSRCIWLHNRINDGQWSKGSFSLRHANKVNKTVPISFESD